MGKDSRIEWTDHTFSPWIGCTKVGPGCDHCYAEAMMDKRLGRVTWGTGNPRQRTSDANWREPFKWNRADFRQCGDCGWRGEVDTLESDECPSCGKHERLDPARQRVFCASLADVFDKEVAGTWRWDLFNLIHNTPNLDWLLLTKRIGNAKLYIEDTMAQLAHEYKLELPWPWPNVWLGATIVNQEEADRDIPKLLATPAAKRFLSIEPMLGPINLKLADRNDIYRVTSTGAPLPLRRVDWVIAGGESGHHARPAHPDWFRSLRDQCVAAGVPFLFKQWGEWRPADIQDSEHDPRCKLIREDGGIVTHILDWPKGTEPQWMKLVGKKDAGRTLDGRTHDEFPK